MKFTIIIIIFTITAFAFLFSSSNSISDTNLSSYSKSIYDYSAKSIDGQTIDFSAYKGKKIMIVNVASKCGYTYQYTQLQELHSRYGDNVAILAFPSNDFLWQEPGTNDQIKTFCSSNYGVTFQMFEKIAVKGTDRHSIYSWLSSKKLNGYKDCVPSWNFNKYIIDENGELIADFGAKVSPLSDEIKNIINR